MPVSSFGPQLVDAEGAHAGEARLISGQRLEQRLDRPPHRAPRGPKLACQTLHGGVLAAHLSDRPPTRPRRQQRPRPGQVILALGERPARAVRVLAPPRPLTPHQFDWPAHARDVDQTDGPSAVAAATTPQTRHASTRAADSTTTPSVGPRRPSSSLTATT